jgi:hypothetical protein
MFKRFHADNSFWFLELIVEIKKSKVDFVLKSTNTFKNDKRLFCCNIFTKFLTQRQTVDKVKASLQNLVLPIDIYYPTLVTCHFSSEKYILW